LRDVGAGAGGFFEGDFADVKTKYGGLSTAAAKAPPPVEMTVFWWGSEATTTATATATATTKAKSRSSARPPLRAKSLAGDPGAAKDDNFKRVLVVGVLGVSNPTINARCARVDHGAPGMGTR
jgi:hypothetical protein